VLTVIADVLHRAEPRGAIAGLGRAEPRDHIAVSCPRATTRGLLLSGRTKSRGHIAVWPICGASRPLESLGATLSLPVSTVCGRRNAMEWKRSLRSWNEMERSGCKADESGQRCGRNRADIWRVGSGSALAPVRDQAQVSAR
jgi:hypothetical protein